MGARQRRRPARRRACTRTKQLCAWRRALRCGHERGGLETPQGAASRKRQGNRRRGYVVRHLRDNNGVVLAEREVRVLDLSTEFFDGATYGLEAVLRIGDKPCDGFRGVTDLMKEKRHAKSPFEGKSSGDGRTMLLKTWGVKKF